jgi:hypothetical protein
MIGIVHDLWKPMERKLRRVYMGGAITNTSCHFVACDSARRMVRNWENRLHSISYIP